jgi:hypothetical protein
MAKIDPMRTFEIDEQRPRFTRTDLAVVVALIAAAAAIVVLSSMFDLRDIAATLAIADGMPLP